MHTVQDEDIDALMARLADGDRSVFSLVFKRLWTPTQRFCMTMLKNEADASWFWVLAATVAVLTGALGGSCVGYAGVVELAIGYTVGVGPGVVRAILRRRGHSNIGA